MVTGSDVAYCVDVMSPWQHDAPDEASMTTLKPAVIPTVVESELVTDDDEWDRPAVHPPPPLPAVAGAPQRCVDITAVTRHVQHAADTDTNCHRPLSVQQGRLHFAFTSCSSSLGS